MFESYFILFFDLGLKYFCLFIFTFTLEKYIISWKNCISLLCCQINKTWQNPSTLIFKISLKSFLNWATVNVRVLSQSLRSLILTIFWELETKYLSAAQFVLKLLALRWNLCLSDMSLSHIRVQLSATVRVCAPKRRCKDSKVSPN